jgi:hypothetical protein
MSTKIINITYEVINQKIEKIANNPRSPHDSAFLNPQLRQKLIVRVLNHVSPHYLFVEESEMDRLIQRDQSISADEERQIEQIVHETILPILQEEKLIQYFQPIANMPNSPEPSHWFG